jgi:hypothetical protein
MKDCILTSKRDLKVKWISAKGKIVNQLNHKCGNATCSNLEHVYDGTQAENMRDRSIHHMHSNSKLESFQCYVENPVSILDALDSILK